MPPVRIAPDSRTPTPSDDARGCTTTQQNAHNTIVEVRYPWHPWFGLKLVCVQVVQRPDGGMLQVVDPESPRSRSRGIPAWMFDSAACVSMGISKQVRVPVRQLRRLQELLAVVGEGGSPVLVEHQHSSDFSVQGGADADNTPTPTHSTESVSAADNSADVTDAAASGAAEGRQADDRTSVRKSQRPTRRKGGVR